MNTFVALLRGINVSGKNMISMKDLERSMASLGFTDIRTYIQSGNLIFETSENEPGRIEEMIAKQIRENFGYEVPVLVITRGDLERIWSGNPLLPGKAGMEDKLHVTLLKSSPPDDLAEKIDRRKYLPDEFIISGREIYLLCPDGYGRTKLTNTFFESKLRSMATTRNWKTMGKLREIASLRTQ